ncbi:glucokinase [Halarcobacter ebronensis]|uniref:Glucokinase n=1 Tax=Halarcobacter ebronensis TaxID=1462615 RepID=A0A4Q0YE91_9BACT|nr:glucokinase [Halarcobacter ebronensis]RXJ67934.1 glucokinase [Halarcobacter ebronensis]
MILAGDIGGTKTNLALYEIKQNQPILVIKEQFSSKNYDSLMQIIKEFHIKNGTPLIEAVCIGIAGPIIEQRCKTTNLPWHINASEIMDFFNTRKVRLLNDLEATAYGMSYLKEEEFVELNPNAKKQKGNIAVIAAGTGLGEAILYWDGVSYTPIGTEGGHSDFAPTTKKEDELLLWLRKKYPSHVSVERVASGMGISNIYDFLVSSNFAKEPSKILNMSEGMDKGAMISKCALEDKDILCQETLKLFMEVYGSEAGNLALKSFSLGGVFIGGGIAPKLLTILKEEYFYNRFISKGRFESLLKTIPLKVSLNQETALLGAVRFAFDKLS